MVALLAALLLSGPPARPPASREAPAAAGEVVRQEVVITNQNLAVVTETRRATLPAGSVALSWPGVGTAARTETWSLTNARQAGVRWLGLSSQPGSSGSPGLVGRRVRVERPGGTSVEAIVVAAAGPAADQMTFREGDALVYGEPGARLVVLDEDPRSSGGVVLKLESGRAGARELTSRYLIDQVGWQANYALTLTPDEKSGRLDGSFAIENGSGGELAPTRLRLLAGTLRTAPAPPRPFAMRAQAAVIGGVPAPSEPASESRIYDVASPGPLPPGRTLLPLVEDAEVPTEKRYLVSTSFWFGQNAEEQPLPVEVRYRLGAKALAAALPAGVVRVYTDGGTVFSGEDRIPHTPEKTDFEVATSEAFDLTARKRQTSYQQTTPREADAAFEVTLTSRKREAASVVVRDGFPGDWTLVSSSVPASRKSAQMVEFVVPVPAGGEARLTYRVHVRMRG